MSSPSRRKNPTLTQRLVSDPYAFEFFQAVRLLEQAAYLRSHKDEGFGTEPVALNTPPHKEAVRFGAQEGLSFPSAQVTKIGIADRSKVKEKAKQWEMKVAFMGLTGPSGIMPHHYTELVLQRLRLKDDSLARFFDLFNHRTVSLFYQAGTKYRLPFGYERHARRSDQRIEHDDFTQAVLSLAGLGTRGLSRRQYARDEALAAYSGFLSTQVRSASGLKHILEQHFEVPVRIHEFLGQWRELIPDVRTTLPSRDFPKGRNNQLGRTALIGDHGWFAQGKFQVIIGPLNKDQFDGLAPGHPKLKAIDEMIRLYCGLESDYEFVIQVNKSYIPDQVSLDSQTPPILGWNSFVAAGGKEQYREDEAVEITVSSRAAY